MSDKMNHVICHGESLFALTEYSVIENLKQVYSYYNLTREFKSHSTQH